MNISIVAESYRHFNFTLKRPQTSNCAQGQQMKRLIFKTAAGVGVNEDTRLFKCYRRLPRLMDFF
jgi:hypothetical protein